MIIQKNSKKFEFNKKIKKFIALMLLLTSSGFASELSNQSQTVRNTTTDDIRMQLQISPEVSSIFGPAGDESRGAGAGGAFLYALSGNFAMGSGVRHVITINKEAKSVFTQFDIRAQIAFNNGLILKREDYLSGGNLKRRRLGGLRLTLAINQYYFENQVTPFSGPGVGISHEFYATPKLNYIIGSRLDRITNGIVSVYPAQIYAGIGYRF